MRECVPTKCASSQNMEMVILDAWVRQERTVYRKDRGIAAVLGIKDYGSKGGGRIFADNTDEFNLDKDIRKLLQKINS